MKPLTALQEGNKMDDSSRDHAPTVGFALEAGDVRAFVAESNRIEGITRPPRKSEIEAHLAFLALPEIRQADLEAFVAVVAPGKPIRDRIGMNVTVGNHRPPGGGRNILQDLYTILTRANRGINPHTVHRDYETLHPFMDGNGRSGRVLWLWQMLRHRADPYVLRRGFLHTFYYQTLSAAR